MSSESVDVTNEWQALLAIVDNLAPYVYQFGFDLQRNMTKFTLAGTRPVQMWVAPDLNFAWLNIMSGDKIVGMLPMRADEAFWKIHERLHDLLIMLRGEEETHIIMIDEPPVPEGFEKPYRKIRRTGMVSHG